MYLETVSYEELMMKQINEYFTYPLKCCRDSCSFISRTMHSNKQA